MNKKPLSTALLAVLLFFAGGHRADAASWRVNSNANRHAHFTDINKAMDDSRVADGDTLYLDPGCLLTSTQNVTKRVTIIGTGYFLNAGAVFQTATINSDIYLKAANIKLEGVFIPNTVWLCADNLVLERCYATYIRWNGTGQHATVRQCYITGRIWGYGRDDMRSAYLTLENSIVISATGDHAVHALYSPIIRNNYLRVASNNSGLYCVYNVMYATITNNIIMNHHYPANVGTNRIECVLKNNINSSTGHDSFIEDVYLDTSTESAVFALSGTNDQRYTLKEDSPAKSAATDGGDCGPFGGLYPYVPSGYPFGMPRFESSSVGTRSVDGQVHVTQQVTIQDQ